MDYLYNPHPSTRHTVFAKNGMVATSQPLAAQAGIEIMRRGGNAIDAAIATAAALTVVEPTSNGIGGDAFALVWVNNKLHGLNASGPAPQSLTIDAVKAQGHDKMPVHGLTPITVPGVPAAWAELARKFGKLPLKESLEPAIRYAEEGYPLTPILGKYWNVAYKKYSTSFTTEEFDAWFTTFAPDGRAPEIGELWKSPDHAATLQSIGASNAESFYTGELADKIDAFMQQHGGYLRKSDLANYQPEWVEPVSTNYRGYDVHEIPPNGQGMIALMALNILSEMNNPVPHDTQSLHEQIESMKLAFTDGQAFITEPTDMPIKPEHLLSKAYAQQRAAKIAATATRPRTIRTTKRRHSLPCNRRRGRQHGIIHPIKLHGLRLRHRHSGHRNRTPKPRRRLLTRPESPKCTKTGQTNIPYHHPRLPNKKRPSNRTIRRHGRIHATARPFPSSHQHHRLQTKSTSSPRRTALAVDKRQSSPRRTGLPEPSCPSTNQTRSPNPADPRLRLIRPRPNHLAQSRNRRPIRRHRIPEPTEPSLSGELFVERIKGIA